MTVDSEILDFYLLMRKTLVDKRDHRHAEHFYRILRKEYCIDIIPEIELGYPTKFVHPLGTVLGRATYAPHMVIYQNVGVGSNLRGERPKFMGPCVLFPGAKVLGRSVIGKNVYITANTVVNDAVVPDNTIVSGDGDHAEWRATKRSVIADYFSGPRSPSPESLAALGAL